MTALRDSRYNKSPKGRARNKAVEKSARRKAYKLEWMQAYRKRLKKAKNKH